ncbi:hypothetical protein SUDANB19_06489 [Streptomyces sp. enrichment culture]
MSDDGTDRAPPSRRSARPPAGGGMEEEPLPTGAEG